MTPFFTLIIATYNASSVLPHLLDSLAAQTCRNFELLIQDGASRDDTVAVAESYRDKLPALSIVSEPDSGIYDAWNKILPQAKGEWILFLGADDELAGSDILKQCRTILSHISEDALYAGGTVETITARGDHVAYHPYRPDGGEKNSWRSMPFPHQGLWHKRVLFGGKQFDDTLRIVADFDFVCRTWTRESGNTILPFIVTRMRRGGVSDSPQSILRARWEEAVVASRYFSGVWTPSRCLGLIKGCLLWAVCRLAGPRRAPKLLDAFRQWRGLPPSWKGL